MSLLKLIWIKLIDNFKFAANEIPNIITISIVKERDVSNDIFAFACIIRP
tara:strand:+ start:153 stop:302 length:150 start_codon:yes stop_codon:yes gene_type:complete